MVWYFRVASGRSGTKSVIDTYPWMSWTSELLYTCCIWYGGQRKFYILHSMGQALLCEPVPGYFLQITRWFLESELVKPNQCQGQANLELLDTVCGR